MMLVTSSVDGERGLDERYSSNITLTGRAMQFQVIEPPVLARSRFVTTTK